MKEYIIEEHGVEYIVNEYVYGTKYWKYEHKLHREYGPAIIYSNDVGTWYQNDRRHRDDGYAASLKPDLHYYYIDDNTKSFYDLLFYEETKGDIK
jgi:hypothetical protein